MQKISKLAKFYPTFILGYSLLPLIASAQIDTVLQRVGGTLNNINAIKIIKPIGSNKSWYDKVNIQIYPKWKWNETFKDRGWGSVFLGNHDFPRMVSRWGNDTDYLSESSKLLFTLMLSMPGTPFVFMGDEIGMTNITLKSVSESQDIETKNGWLEAKKRNVEESEFLKVANYAGRDNARTPFQWTASAQAGFTTGRPWMQINPNQSFINVNSQQDAPDSILNYFRSVVKLRKEHQLLTYGKYKPIETEAHNLFIFFREDEQEKLLILLNFSNEVTK